MKSARVCLLYNRCSLGGDISGAQQEAAAAWPGEGGADVQVDMRARLFSLFPTCASPSHHSAAGAGGVGILSMNSAIFTSTWIIHAGS